MRRASVIQGWNLFSTLRESFARLTQPERVARMPRRRSRRLPLLARVYALPGTFARLDPRRRLPILVVPRTYIALLALVARKRYPRVGTVPVETI